MKKAIIVLVGAVIVTIVGVSVYLVIRSLPTPVINKDTTNSIAHESKDTESVVSYTHPSGKFSYDYPDTWEFVPKREDMGLRPKEYSGYSKNEIVTIIYFEGKGTDLKAWAKTYDGGFDEDWVDKTVFNKPALFYNYSSDKLDNLIYYFGNGKDAVKVMFRKFNSFGTEGQKDNTRFEDDFNLILKSFKFN